MKVILLICTVLCMAYNLKAQDKADYFYKAGYFKEAITIYEKELSRNRVAKKPVQIKLADSYFQMHDFTKSLRLYEDLFNQGQKDSLTLYRLAELSRMFCDYDKAEQYYSVYQKSNANGAKQQFDAIISNKVKYPQEHDEVDERTKLSEIKLPRFRKGMGYSYFSDGDLIGGIEKKDKEKKTTFTTLGVFSSSSDFQEVVEYDFNSETSFFNAYPSYCPEQEQLFFTANRMDKKKSFKEGKNVLQIFSVSTQGATQEHEPLPFNSDNYNYTHPSITKSGNRLYFVSDEPGGYGGYDIYYVEKTRDGWSEMINCGAGVNSTFDELTPFINGDTLFFSSYGHKNYGGSDIFMSINKNDGFSRPTNMGLPVNSCMNDFAFIFNAADNTGLLTSDRNAVDSREDDVFRLTIPKSLNKVSSDDAGDPIADVAVLINNDEEISTDKNGEWIKNIAPGENVKITFDHPFYETKTLDFNGITEQQIEEIKDVKLTPVMLSGKAVDDITGKPLAGVAVQLFEKTENDDWKQIETKTSDNNGEWEFHVRKDREYKVLFEKEDYLSHNEIVPKLSNADSRKLRNEVVSRMNPFSMKYKARKDLVIQIDNIYFDLNSSYIQEKSMPVLKKLKGFLNENPNVKIELSAHTDCQGEDKYNLWLSDRRAKNTKEYLVNNGIAPERIQAKGYGEEKMIVTDCELQKRDDTEAQKNRRVEVKIL